MKTYILMLVMMMHIQQQLKYLKIVKHHLFCVDMKKLDYHQNIPK